MKSSGIIERNTINILDVGQRLFIENCTNNEVNLEEYITQFEHVITCGDVTIH